MELLFKICRLDTSLRRMFLEELVRVQKETSKSIDKDALRRIDSGKPFEGINVWERAYSRYSTDLDEERRGIKELNEELTSGKIIKWEDLVGFFGFLLGYHEYVVHPVRLDNLFDDGNSGFFFRNQARMFSGIKQKKNSPYFRGATAFDNFCVAYYVAKNSSSGVESHFERFREDELDFSKANTDKALESSYKINELLDKNPPQSFVKNIEAIYSNMKKLAKNNPYKKPLMPTIAGVRPDKRIKRFQCRVAEGPLTPPEPNANLYRKSETLRWHRGVSDELRRKLQAKT